MNSAKNIAKSLKNLRMGDLLEIPLDTVERKIINEEKKRDPSKND